MADVLHVIQRFDDGGASRSMLTMAATSARSGAHHHRIVSLLRPHAPALERATRLGLPVSECAAHQDLTTAMAAADIVQVHFWNTPEMMECLRGPLPEMRLLVRLNIGGRFAPQVLTRALVAFADCIAVGSPMTLELPVWSEIPPEDRGRRGVLLHPAADFARLDGLVRASHETFDVGYVGTVDFTKMHPSFMHLCASIRVPTARFIVRGGGGALATLRRQADALGMADRVDIAGPVEDIRSIFSTLDVLGYPLCEDNYSSSEAVLHEAMHAGVPPVVFDHGGAARTVVHEQTGLVVRSERDYCEAIEYLHACPEVRRQLAENAKAYAAANFGADNAVRQLHDIYASLLVHPKRVRQWPGGPVARASHHGTALFLESLGDLARHFACSVEAGDSEAAIAADAEIARASDVLLNPGGGGLMHYRQHFPEAGHLRLWSGLVLQHRGRHALALAEFLAARRHGCDHWRVWWYLARSAEQLGQVDLARQYRLEVRRAAPEFDIGHVDLPGAGENADA